MGFKKYNKSIIAEASDNYSVMAGDGDSDGFEIQKAKTPKEAITFWINAQGYASMNVTISAKDDKLKRAFYDWIFNNLEWYAKAINKQKPYKPNYLYTEVQTVNVEKTDKDTLHPFTVG